MPFRAKVMPLVVGYDVTIPIYIRVSRYASVLPPNPDKKKNKPTE